MDGGVISIVKTHYKHLVLSAAIKAAESKNTSYIDFLKKITILDAIQMFDIAWSKVPESAMRNVWKKLMPHSVKARKITNVNHVANHFLQEI